MTVSPTAIQAFEQRDGSQELPALLDDRPPEPLLVDLPATLWLSSPGSPDVLLLLLLLLLRLVI